MAGLEKNARTGRPFCLICFLLNFVAFFRPFEFFYIFRFLFTLVSDYQLLFFPSYLYDFGCCSDVEPTRANTPEINSIIHPNYS